MLLSLGSTAKHLIPKYSKEIPYHSIVVRDCYLNHYSKPILGAKTFKIYLQDSLILLFLAEKGTTFNKFFYINLATNAVFAPQKVHLLFDF